MLVSLGLSLGLTLFLELTFAYIFGLRSKQDFLLVALVNVFTNPAVVMTCNLIALFSCMPVPWYWIVSLEALAVLTEGLIYRAGLIYRRIHPLFLSLILNGISYLGGFLLS